VLQDIGFPCRLIFFQLAAPNSCEGNWDANYWVDVGTSRVLVLYGSVVPYFYEYDYKSNKRSKVISKVFPIVYIFGADFFFLTNLFPFTWFKLKGIPLAVGQVLKRKVMVGWERDGWEQRWSVGFYYGFSHHKCLSMFDKNCMPPLFWSLLYLILSKLCYTKSLFFSIEFICHYF